jgi:hypothetical protein
MCNIDLYYFMQVYNGSIFLKNGLLYKIKSWSQPFYITFSDFVL